MLKRFSSSLRQSSPSQSQLGTKDEWLANCLRLAKQPADFYSGCRKILRNHSFSLLPLDKSLQLADAGYAINKLRQLQRHYVHAESRTAALRLWQERVRKDKYGSVSFHCFNHLVKSEKKSPRGSVMGPCLQTVTLTYISRDVQVVDCTYRTTELFKKFPADLILLRDILLPGFKASLINFHFTNITLHPMYFVVPLAHMKHGIDELIGIRDVDKFFHDWVVKWTARYMCPEYSRGIQKFSQALRVQKSALEKITGKDRIQLIKYLRDNHPGYRNEYEEEDDT